MKKLLFLIILALITGCGPSEKQIAGSVFVVTKGGENIKLGLIPISVTPISVFNEKITNAIDKFDKFYHKNKPIFDKNLSEYLEDKKNFDAIKSEINKNEKIINEYIAGAEIDRNISIFRSWHEIKVYSSQYSAVGQSFLENLNKAVNEKNNLTKKAEPVLARMNANAAILYKIKSEAEYISDRRVREFFVDLSDTAIKTSSDADGKFILKIKGDEKHVLTAYGSRSVGSRTEDYNWLKEIDLKNSSENISILISNDTLVDHIPGDGYLEKVIAEFNFSCDNTLDPIEENFRLTDKSK